MDAPYQNLFMRSENISFDFESKIKKNFVFPNTYIHVLGFYEII